MDKTITTSMNPNGTKELSMLCNIDSGLKKTVSYFDSTLLKKEIEKEITVSNTVTVYIYIYIYYRFQWQ